MELCARLQFPVILALGFVDKFLLWDSFLLVLVFINCQFDWPQYITGLTVIVDSVMWRLLLWPEFEVFWFNSVLNRSSEWGVSSFHWYFTSALPRSLLAAYPLFLLGLLLDRRIWAYLLPVLSFVIVYSKLSHKELRFIIYSLPVFNLAAAVSASRIYNNRKKRFWGLLYIGMLGLFLIRYSKEEGLALLDYRHRNFTYLLNEHGSIDGYKCLFSVDAFAGVRLRKGFPPVVLVKEPKVYAHGSASKMDLSGGDWPMC